jgi:cytochrome c-type biogenesis protein CcmE
VALTEDGQPPVDLTPRTSAGPDPTAARGRRRNPWAWVVLVLVLVGLGVVVFQGLRSATLYYRNADEAVADRDSLGDRRFRLQGVVQDDLVTVGEAFDFTVAFNGVSVPVHYAGGEPSDLFRPCVPVVLEGRWEGDTFASDRILIKHSSTYEAEHPDRLSPTGTDCP